MGPCTCASAMAGCAARALLQGSPSPLRDWNWFKMKEKKNKSNPSKHTNHISLKYISLNKLINT